MATTDRCCSIHPYFKVNEGKLPAFRALCERFVAKTQGEERCLYYGFSFDGDQVHCREGYRDADGLLFHLENVGALLQEHKRTFGMIGGVLIIVLGLHTAGVFKIPFLLAEKRAKGPATKRTAKRTTKKATARKAPAKRATAKRTAKKA